MNYDYIHETLSEQRERYRREHRQLATCIVLVLCACAVGAVGLWWIG